MKAAFLFTGPHWIHETWARALGAEFVSNKIETEAFEVIPFFSRFFKSFAVLGKIPKETELLLLEGGAGLLAGALWKRKNPKGKLVLIVDDPTFYRLEKANPVKRALIEWSCRYVDLFLPTTKLMKKGIPKTVEEEKIKLSPAFVFLEKFSKRKIDLKSKGIVVAGTVAAEKGVDRTIEIFKELRKEFPDARLYVCGLGPLEKAVRETEGAQAFGNVKDAGAVMEKGTIYHDLAILEPAGAAVVEAMAVGLVPFVSPQVGNKFVVEKVAPELVVENNEQVIEVTRKLWNNPALLKKYSEKCKKAALEMSKEKSVKFFLQNISSLELGK